MDTSKRRYDLDWLRVIAILAVYFHHIGMPFNGDDFHIMNAESSKLLDDIMVYFEQFRLPLLFLISGTGTVLAFSKRTWTRFLKERTGRLLIPLIFGVLVIVPPQTYFQYIDQYDSVWDVITSFRLETNHLWFIENLYIISIIAIPLILFFRSDKSNRLLSALGKVCSHPFGFILLSLPLIVFTVILKRYYPSGSSVLTNFSETFYDCYFFVAGIIFANSQLFWDQLKKRRKLHIWFLIVSSVLFYGYYYVPGNWLEPYLSLAVRWDLWYVVCCLVGWSFVLTILGYAQVFLNKPSKHLKKMNEAIYPFYILHQTIIVALAYYIVQLDVSIPVKLLLLFIGSFPVIVVLYRYLIYPFKLTRILFGMKNKPKT